MTMKFELPTRRYVQDNPFGKGQPRRIRDLYAEHGLGVQEIALAVGTTTEEVRRSLLRKPKRVYHQAAPSKRAIRERENRIEPPQWPASVPDDLGGDGFDLPDPGRIFGVGHLGTRCHLARRPDGCPGCDRAYGDGGSAAGEVVGELT